MAQITFDRLQGWPRPLTRDRKSASTFRVTHEQTRKELEKEIERIDGTAIMLQADIDPQKVKRDGWPYADAKSRAHPGVIISFVRKGKRLFFACDEYELWQHNVRGILLTLELLRGIARHGVAQSEEQYEGFGRQLPPKPPVPPKPEPKPTPPKAKPEPTLPRSRESAPLAIPKNKADATTVLLRAAKRPITVASTQAVQRSGTSRREVYLAAVKNVHPDIGGSHNDAVAVNAAYEMLGAG